MAEISIVVVLLAVLCAAAVTMTAIMLVTALDLRRVLRRLDHTTLPHCDATAQEARKMLAQARHILTRTNHAAGRVQSVVDRACDAASGAMDGWGEVSSHMQSWIRGHGSNGAGSGRSRRLSRGQ
jgi:hypothetical protein